MSGRLGNFGEKANRIPILGSRLSRKVQLVWGKHGFSTGPLAFGFGAASFRDCR